MLILIISGPSTVLAVHTELQEDVLQGRGPVEVHQGGGVVFSKKGAVAHHAHDVATPGLFNVMGGDEDGGPSGPKVGHGPAQHRGHGLQWSGEVQQVVPDGFPEHGVHPDSGLVKDQQFRTVKK